MGHAVGGGFYLSAAGHVWPNGKWQGAFQGLDRERLNPVTAYPPQQVSRGILHSGHGEVPPELLCDASAGDLEATSHLRGRSAVCHAMQKQTWRSSLARSSSEQADELHPFCPHVPRHPRDWIDLSWFHSARGPAGLYVSNICHPELPHAK